MKSFPAMLCRITATVVLTMLATAPLSAQQPLPLKYTGPATSAAITPGDLMTRLYIYADDSMMGRRVGTEDNIRATDYIEREVRRLGLVPAGDKGSYFQYLSTFARAMDPTSSGSAAGMKLIPGTDFSGNQIGARSGNVVFGGMRGDTLAPEMIKGKVVVVTTPLATGGGRGGFGGGRGAGGAAPALYAGAAALVSVGPDLLPTVPARVQVTETPETMVGAPVADDQPLQYTITPRVAASLFGKPVEQVAKGTQGGVLNVNIKYLAAPAPSRNVVAILPGTDPTLKNEYVLIGAHNDHVGYNNRPADHDSLKAFADVFLIQGADSRPSPEALTDQTKWAQVNGKIAAARRLGGVSRSDSIYNGADDDGSGSVTVLEVAEAFAKGTAKPKRSIIFIWQTGEESGMWGSGWFVDHPTVPRESIVAAVNMDMVGRGFSADVTGSTKAGGLIFGGPGYLQLVGSRRLSKEYGDLVETVNTEKKLGFTFDYEIDADGHPQNIYCRSDHWSYARYGIPVVFFTTGGHSDYHQVTDEPQYINYPHMADVAKLGFEVVLRAANLGHRVKVDAPGPFDGKARCRQ